MRSALVLSLCMLARPHFPSAKWASVVANKNAIIRAYLVPDTGTAPIQRIEFQAEPDVEHLLQFENLKPGTLYRLKLFYVPNTCKTKLSSTGTFLRREGREILRSFKSDKFEARSQSSARIKTGTTAGDTQCSDVLIRRATGGAALESTTGHYEALADVTLPREGFPREKPLAVSMNYPKKPEVRTLPADWKGKEGTRQKTATLPSAVGPK